MDNFLHQSFQDVGWLQVYGLGVHNALDYFALSQFYDRTCNNEIAPFALICNAVVGWWAWSMRSCMSKNPAYSSFATNTASPPTRVIGSYYVLDGVIYQVPTVQNILSARLMMALHHTERAFKAAQQAVDYQPDCGYTWKSPNAADGDEIAAAAAGSNLLRFDFGRIVMDTHQRQSNS